MNVGKIAATLVLIFILGGGIYVFLNSGKIPGIGKKSQASSLGEQIYNQQNPLGEKAPEVNPFSKINPFKGVYKNPFE
ncbi:hypothetical protein HYS92_01025 [Candidatus Daviesbacteria bacterium]|nr:hypothetical protein [Candidatus Daviesbacteria bacterium]